MVSFPCRKGGEKGLTGGNMRDDQVNDGAERVDVMCYDKGQFDKKWGINWGPVIGLLLCLLSGWLVWTIYSLAVHGGWK